MPRFRVPEVTVERLSIYLRALKKFSDDRIISSQDLAEIVGTTDAQVRKDFALTSLVWVYKEDTPQGKWQQYLHFH